jgi:hypothetical protein
MNKMSNVGKGGRRSRGPLKEVFKKRSKRRNMDRVSTHQAIEADLHGEKVHVQEMQMSSGTVGSQ